MSREHAGLLVLFLAVVGSALGVVYTEHQSRRLFAELQALQREQDRMNEEWGRLQLEQSTWATHGRVERAARTELDMHIPKPDEVVIIRQ
ncbi:MAG: cell division protein FtsL [Gammaproteobacteria bacterium]|nr:cell division protein FtsL [Gammaproteobacteria bacterium]NIR98312.1 cell division protein FtsL [Gammaproteobacteria bacterium]NIT64059.1 cell division protein FtsL [Gammaproteobacteria bacterium]NIV20990.1 cell division protein FtsL [Gammaproteobacteria bacterium]NIX10387.1 cell division protein FtsL [Gammaproteobacteria bacterium]